MRGLPVQPGLAGWLRKFSCLDHMTYGILKLKNLAPVGSKRGGGDAFIEILSAIHCRLCFSPQELLAYASVSSGFGPPLSLIRRRTFVLAPSLAACSIASFSSVPRSENTCLLRTPSSILQLLIIHTVANPPLHVRNPVVRPHGGHFSTLLKICSTRCHVTPSINVYLM
jgi:hypothetical protein